MTQSYIKMTTAPSKKYTVLFQSGVVIAALLIWYLLTSTQVVTPDQLPALGKTVSSIRVILTSANTLHDLFVSTYEIIVAFLIAMVTGIGIGFLVGENGHRWPGLKRFFESGLGSTLSTPKFIFLPVLVLIIGAGYWEKVIYGLSDGIIIMILAASEAAYTVGANERLLARSYMMKRSQFFTKVFLPSALLPVFEALRISMVLVVSGVLLAEMYISNAGMGFLIFKAGTEDEVPLLIAAILVVAALAIVLNSIFQLIEKILNRWHS